MAIIRPFFEQATLKYVDWKPLLFFQASEDRLELVATFAVSALASNFERMGKPFNPLLGETYELTRNDFRIVCEQVGHHPPVSAWHATGKDGRWFHELSLTKNLRIFKETEFYLVQLIEHPILRIPNILFVYVLSIFSR